MIRLTLGDIAGVVDGRLHPSDCADVVVSGPATVDSRDVARDGLFAALVGERVDGHDYLARARAAGAAASLVSRPLVDPNAGPQVAVPDVIAALGRLSRAVIDRLVLTGDLTVVAVTGSSGKTSTKDMLGQVLALAGPTVAPQESYNNEIGVPLTALRAERSTRQLVLEMGARGAGHIARLARLAPPRIGLVLNVGAAHAGEFGGKQATARAKSELVQALPAAEAAGVAVLNADDPLVLAMAASTSARVVTFGTTSRADVRATDIALDERGRASFRLHTRSAAADVSLHAVGAHQVSNALGAAAVALDIGLDLDVVARALSAATPRSRWRMEVVDRADGSVVVNDAYNANPDSMRAALEALNALAGGRRTWAVLGEMLELGAASATEHAEIGRLAHELGVDRLVVVGEGARGIHAGAVADGARDGEESVVVPTAEDALALVRAGLQPGEVVLVKASRAAGLERVAIELLQEVSA